MSRGHGQVQRAILAAFKAEPDNAFLLSELCERVYPGLNRVEKKHRNAVARAAKAIPSITYWHREALGSELVFCDPLNVMSYAMARLKSDFLNNYRNNDARWFTPRPEWFRKAMDYKKGYEYQRPQATEDKLRKRLAEGGSNHKDVIEGGVWWLHTEIRKAEARGDQETLARLQAKQDADLAEVLAQARAFRERTQAPSD